MNRRELLLLRPTPRARVFELPCERLFMQYVDRQRQNAALTTAGPESWLGEPEARYDVGSVGELLAGLEAELGSAEVVRVVGREWLADEGLRRAVDRLLTEMITRGGRVEWA
jgi:hypothetical protein